MEHNILVLTNVYLNITFDELGRFLGIESEKAERLIATMVAEDRIKARLDQRKRIVDFDMGSDRMIMWNT